jgi:hypothetical protein
MVVGCLNKKLNEMEALMIYEEFKKEYHVLVDQVLSLIDKAVRFRLLSPVGNIIDEEKYFLFLEKTFKETIAETKLIQRNLFEVEKVENKNLKRIQVKALLSILGSFERSKILLMISSRVKDIDVENTLKMIREMEEQAWDEWMEWIRINPILTIKAEKRKQRGKL